MSGSAQQRQPQAAAPDTGQPGIDPRLMPQQESTLGSIVRQLLPAAVLGTGAAFAAPSGSSSGQVAGQAILGALQGYQSAQPTEQDLYYKERLNMARMRDSQLLKEMSNEAEYLKDKTPEQQQRFKADPKGFMLNQRLTEEREKDRPELAQIFGLPLDQQLHLSDQESAQAVLHFRQEKEKEEAALKRIEKQGGVQAANLRLEASLRKPDRSFEEYVDLDPKSPTYGQLMRALVDKETGQKFVFGGGVKTGVSADPVMQMAVEAKAKLDAGTKLEDLSKPLQDAYAKKIGPKDVSKEAHDKARATLEEQAAAAITRGQKALEQADQLEKIGTPKAMQQADILRAEAYKSLAGYTKGEADVARPVIAAGVEAVKLPFREALSDHQTKARDASEVLKQGGRVDLKNMEIAAGQALAKINQSGRIEIEGIQLANRMVVENAQASVRERLQTAQLAAQRAMHNDTEYNRWIALKENERAAQALENQQHIHKLELDGNHDQAQKIFKEQEHRFRLEEEQEKLAGRKALATDREAAAGKRIKEQTRNEEHLTRLRNQYSVALDAVRGARASAAQKANYGQRMLKYRSDAMMHYYNNHLKNRTPEQKMVGKAPSPMEWQRSPDGQSAQQLVDRDFPPPMAAHDPVKALVDKY